ncbi:MAG: hypothetical protein GY842_27830 [bacterium]|nr:hypothetical protein [bacterium]
MTQNARQAYVNAVVTNYLRLPGTPLRASRRDRQLAAALHDRGVPLRVVWAAFVIASVRWAIRAPQQRRLDRIRTLYYFLPALDEVTENPPETAYVEYLAAKLRPFVAQKEAQIASSITG